MGSDGSPKSADAAPGSRRKRGRGADPAATRDALTGAAFESLRVEGYRGTTARSIAGRAGCNQAAIYYHFSGIEHLLVEALRRSSERRLERYRVALDGVVELPLLVGSLATLYEEDRASGHLEVLAELIAAITSSPELRAGIQAATAPWITFVEERVRAVAETMPFGDAVPVEDLADLVFSLVIGLELRNKVDGNTDRASRLFRLASLGASLLATSTATPSAPASNTTAPGSPTSAPASTPSAPASPRHPAD